MEDVSNPDYWKRRIESARSIGQDWKSVFLVHSDRWERILARHRRALFRIGPKESVLDAGCGYGRLLDLMPSFWRGKYLGVDFSPDFIAWAKERYPTRADSFVVGNLINLDFLPPGTFDWAVIVSIRPMVVRNLGGAVWDRMESEIRRVARNLLFLEYDETNPDRED